MIYRIQVNAFFDDPDPALDILDKVKDYIDDWKTVNPGQPNEQRSFVIYEECRHDMQPPEPCTIVEEHHSNG